MNSIKTDSSEVTIKKQLSQPLLQMEHLNFKNVCGLPKIVGDKIFVAHLNGEIKAYTRISQELLWLCDLQTPFLDGLGSEGQDGLLVDDTLIYTFAKNELVCINTESGIIVKKISLKYSIEIRSAFIYKSILVTRIFDEDADEFYYIAFDLIKEEVVWKHLCANTNSQSSSWVDDKNNLTILSLSEETLSAVDTFTGQIVWQTSVADIGLHHELHENLQTPFRSGEIVGIPVILNQLVVVSVKGYYLVAISIHNGSVVWKQKVDAIIPSSFTSFDKSVILLGVENLYQLNGQTGEFESIISIKEELRSKNVAGLHTLITLTNAHVLFSDSSKGTLIAMNKSNGKIEWTFQCKNAIPFSYAPLVVDDCMYIIDVEGNMYAFKSS